jgi:DNA-binding NarL/FixJ family response regulator
VRTSSEDETRLLAEVQDDGRGFDQTEERPPAGASDTGGTGIRGMYERARLLGGELKIESDPGQGTKVSLEMPLHEGAEDRPQEQQEEEEEQVRVLLVDEHTAIREALASTFEGAGFALVGQAGSLAEARRMLEEVEQEIDVAIVDLGLPDGYGADLIPQLREANPQAQALVLSATLDRANMARAVERGAAGILNKTAHLEEVVEAVRRLRAGETLMPLEEVVELLRYAGSEREHEYEARKAIETLTYREREVLEALTEGLGSEGIAERLSISVRTERNHMSSILAKLGVHSQLQALVFAVCHGLVEIS